MSTPVARSDDPGRWLDNWLEQAASASDGKIRANAVVALVALGGIRRMQQLARLLGKAVTEAMHGSIEAAEVLAVALRETESKEFSDVDRQALLDALGRDKESPDYDARAGVMAMLRRTNPFSEWRAIRRATPRAGVVELLVSSFRASLLVSLALWLALFLVAGLIWGFGNVMSVLSQALGPAAVLVAVATGCAAMGARTATRGLSGKTVLVDAVFVGFAAATVGAVLVALIMSAAGTGPFMDVINRATGSRDFFEEEKPFAWNSLPFVFFAFAFPGLAAVRLLIGKSARALTRTELVVSSIGWPILVATIFALAFTRWGPAEMLEAVSAAWVGFVASAVALAATIAAVSADWRWSTVHNDGRDFSSRLLASGRIAFGITLIFVAGVALATRWGSSASRELVNLPQEDEMIEVRLMADKPVLITGPVGASVRIARTSSRRSRESPIRIRNGNSVVTLPATYRSTPPTVSVTLKDPVLEACATDNLREGPCKLPDLMPTSWLMHLVGGYSGNREPRDNGASAEEPERLVVLRYRPAETAELPKDVVGQPSPSGTLTAGKPFLTTSPAAIWKFDVPARQHLYAKPATPDDGQNRHLVLERIEKTPTGEQTEIVRDVQASSGLMFDLSPGTYRICLRLFNYFFRECDGASYELLSEPIEISFSEKAPAERRLPPLPSLPPPPPRP